MKRYLFFLRHFNDIDNISPAIFFLLERRHDVRADVVIYSWDYDYRADPNLAMLRERFGERFSVEWLGGRLGIPTLALENATVRSALARGRYVGRSEWNLESVVSGKVAPEHLETALAAILRSPAPPEKVIFDQNRASVVRGLLNSLRSQWSGPIVTLPVSPWTNINVLRQVDFVRLGSDRFHRKHDYDGFDTIGVVDDHYPKALANIFRLLGAQSPLEGKYQVLGSARYSTEWLEIRRKIGGSFEYGSKGPRLLLLLSAPKANSFWDEALRTIEFLTNFPEYSVVVKPHTRYAIRPDATAHFRIAEDVDTSALIDWADIILFWGTSVALEGYSKGKYMVCLDYINGNRSIYRLFDAGRILTCRDDLFEVLTLFKSAPETVAYSQDNVRRLLQSVVGAGTAGSVAERYVDFLTEPTTAGYQLGSVVHQTK